jgi:hypothetical protein
MFQNQMSAHQQWGWTNSRSACALANDDRHLGHVIKVAGRWQAFDSTRSNDDGTGFCFLGSYASLVTAKQAVELSQHGASSPQQLLSAA